MHFNQIYFDRDEFTFVLAFDPDRLIDFWCLCVCMFFEEKKNHNNTRWLQRAAALSITPYEMSRVV